MDKMIAWFAGLTELQSLLVAGMLFVVGLLFIILICALIFRRIDRMEKKEITVLPTEADLRRRDEENSRRAYLKYTASKKEIR